MLIVSVLCLSLFAIACGGEPQRYTISYSTENQAYGSVSGTCDSGSKVEADTDITLTATAKEGYTFEKWCLSGTDTTVCETAIYNFTMPNSDYSVEAKFTINSYVLNVEFDETACSVTITEEHSSNVYQSGDSVVFNTPLIITITEKTGYDFVKIVEGQEQISTLSVYTFNMPAKEYNLNIETKLEKRKVQFISQSVIIKTVEVDYNTCVESFEPTRDNYRFINWYEDAGLSRLYDFDAKIVEDISLYADWEETTKTYLVEFVDWNGKRIDTIQTIPEGESATIPATPTREGYEFDKWVADDGDYREVDRNMVVRATYIITTYDVVFYKDSAKTQVHKTEEVEHGSLAPFPPAIPDIASNLVFDKWVDEDGVEFNFKTPIIDNINLIATYKEKTKTVYEVTFYANGSLIDTQYVEEGDFANEPNVVPKQGEKLSGWDKDITKAINENTTFTAQFTPITFTVTFVDYNQTVIDVQMVNYNNSATKPDDPTREGYTFRGWDKAFSNVLEDLTITAKYDVIVLTATYYDNDTYLGEITADYGTAFAVLATPMKDGYSFDGWYIDKDLTQKYGFTTEKATTDITLYAKYDEIELPVYTVKFYVDGKVYSEQSIYQGKDAVAPGIPVMVGHTFDRWNGNFTNVTSNLEISAIFNINVYTVSFYDKEGNDLIATVNVNYGESANAPVAPDVDGHTFVKWSEDVSFVVEDIEVYAIYDKNVVAVTFLDADDESVIANSSAVYGGKVSVIKTPSKMGSIFTGWYADKACTEEFNFDTIIEEPTTIYAGWDEIFRTCTVTFKVEGETYGKVQRVALGRYALKPALPSGYTVWRVEGTNEIFEFTTAITEHIVLYADTE